MRKVIAINFPLDNTDKHTSRRLGVCLNQKALLAEYNPEEVAYYDA